MSENMNSDEISLKELIHAILNQKKTIVVITLIVVILSGLYTVYQSSNNKSARLIVSFNFDGVEIHKNHDGSDFNPYQVVTPHVLSNVLETLNLRDHITVNQVRSLIEIEPLIPDDVIALEEYALEKSGESYTYYPNEYLMTLKVNASYGIDEQIAQRIENAIITEYSAYFNETYLYQVPVANKLIGFDPANYDYSDVSRVYHSQIDAIKAYVLAHDKIDPDFRSKRTGMSFDDIYNNISLVDDVDMNKLDSMISAYKITKDESRLIIYYEYMVEQLEYQLSKYSSETDVRTNILNTLEDSSNNIVESISGVTLTNGDSYFNSLILRTADLGQTASSIQKQVTYYQNELNDLRSGNYQTSYDKDAVLSQVESLILSLDEDIKKWYDITLGTTDEFYDTYLSNTFYALSPSEIYDSGNNLLNIAIGVVLGLMLGVFVGLFKAYWNDGLGGGHHEN